MAPKLWTATDETPTSYVRDSDTHPPPDFAHGCFSSFGQPPTFVYRMFAERSSNTPPSISSSSPS